MGLGDVYKRQNIELPNLKKIKLDNSNFLFHAGTSKKKGEIFTELITQNSMER